MTVCSCWKAGQCPVGRLAKILDTTIDRVAALEALRDKLLALDALWEAGGPEQQPRCGLCDYHPCGFPLLECPGFRPKQQGDPESEEYINNLMMRLKREPEQQPRSCDNCDIKPCSAREYIPRIPCTEWQPREGGGA